MEIDRLNARIEFLREFIHQISMILSSTSRYYYDMYDNGGGAKGIPRLPRLCLQFKIGQDGGDNTPDSALPPKSRARCFLLGL